MPAVLAQHPAHRLARSTKGGEYSPPMPRCAPRDSRRAAPLNEGRGIFPANAGSARASRADSRSAQRRAGNIPRQCSVRGRPSAVVRPAQRRAGNIPRQCRVGCGWDIGSSAALNEGRGIFPANAARGRCGRCRRAPPLNEGRGIFPANAAPTRRSARLFARALNEGRGIFPANASRPTRPWWTGVPAQRRAGNIPRQCDLAVDTESQGRGRSTKGGEYSPPMRAPGGCAGDELARSTKGGEYSPPMPRVADESRVAVARSTKGGEYSPPMLRLPSRLRSGRRCAQRRAGNIPRQCDAVGARASIARTALNEGRGIFPANAPSVERRRPAPQRSTKGGEYSPPMRLHCVCCCHAARRAQRRAGNIPRQCLGSFTK